MTISDKQLELCQSHGEQLRSHDGRLCQIEQQVARIDGRTELLVEVLVPKRRRQSERPPPGDIAIKTKWGSIRGGAPWVAVLALLSAALWVAGRVLS